MARCLEILVDVVIEGGDIDLSFAMGVLKPCEKVNEVSNSIFSPGQQILQQCSLKGKSKF
jgi:hypothetical protein